MLRQGFFFYNQFRSYEINLYFHALFLQSRWDKDNFFLDKNAIHLSNINNITEKYPFFKK